MKLSAAFLFIFSLSSVQALALTLTELATQGRQEIQQLRAEQRSHSAALDISLRRWENLLAHASKVEQLKKDINLCKTTTCEDTAYGFIIASLSKMSLVGRADFERSSEAPRALDAVVSEEIAVLTQSCTYNSWMGFGPTRIDVGCTLKGKKQKAEELEKLIRSQIEIAIHSSKTEPSYRCLIKIAEYISIFDRTAIRDDLNDLRATDCAATLARRRYKQKNDSVDVLLEAFNSLCNKDYSDFSNSFMSFIASKWDENSAKISEHFYFVRREQTCGLGGPR